MRREASRRLSSERLSNDRCARHLGCWRLAGQSHVVHGAASFVRLVFPRSSSVCTEVAARAELTKVNASLLRAV